MSAEPSVYPVTPLPPLGGKRRRPRILLVNDDEDSLFLLARSVRKAMPEADVTLLQSAPAALEYFKDHPVDAVITDNKMPEMDGLTLVRRIRERDAGVPILMVTGSLDMSAPAADAGVTAYLSRMCWGEVGKELKNLLSV